MFLSNLVPVLLSGNTMQRIFEDLHFAPDTLKETLPYMGIGMGGIFVALLIIYLFSILLQKIFPEKNGADQKADDA